MHRTGRGAASHTMKLGPCPDATPRMLKMGRLIEHEG